MTIFHFIIINQWHFHWDHESHFLSILTKFNFYFYDCPKFYLIRFCINSFLLYVCLSNCRVSFYYSHLQFYIYLVLRYIHYFSIFLPFKFWKNSLLFLEKLRFGFLLFPSCESIIQFLIFFILIFFWLFLNFTWFHLILFRKTYFY